MKIVENMCLKCMFGKMELSCGYQSITHEYAGERTSGRKTPFSVQNVDLQQVFVILISSLYKQTLIEHRYASIKLKETMSS